MRDKIKAMAHKIGFDLVGVCGVERAESVEFARLWVESGFHGSMGFMAKSLPIRGDAQSILPGATSAIVVGLNYFQPSEPVAGQPRIAKYALGRDYHKVIRGKLRALARGLSDQLPGEQFRACVDSAPIFEREFAVRAGLGWLGKNSCLINTRKGSWFFIGVLLTTARLEVDKVASGGCGTCKKCVDACPTGAIVQLEGRWTVDSRRCVSYVTIEHRGPIDAELHRGVGDWTFGCDICQDVCPFNAPRAHQPERSAVTKESDFLDVREWPSLVELAELSGESWDAMTRGSATRRAKAEQWRRNAKLNLENGKVL